MNDVLANYPARFYTHDHWVRGSERGSWGVRLRSDWGQREGWLAVMVHRQVSTSTIHLYVHMAGGYSEVTHSGKVNKYDKDI